MDRNHRHGKDGIQFFFLPALQRVPDHQVVQWRSEGALVQEVLQLPALQPQEEKEAFVLLFWADPQPVKRAACQATTAWMRAHETDFTITWYVIDPATTQAEMLVFIQSVHQPQRRLVMRFALPEWEIALLNSIVATEIVFFVCPSPQSPAPHDLVNTIVTYDVVQKMMRSSLHASLTITPDEKAIKGLLQMLTYFALLNPASRLKEQLL